MLTKKHAESPTFPTLVDEVADYDRAFGRDGDHSRATSIWPAVLLAGVPAIVVYGSWRLFVLWVSQLDLVLP